MNYLILLLSLISCAGDDFPQRSELADLRVLGIAADQPEINSATTINLTPLISYVDGDGANLNYSWQACPDPGIDFGAELNCDETTANLKQSGSGSFDTDTLSSSFYTGNATSISLVIPTAAFTYLATLDDDLQYNGLDYVIFLTYEDEATSTTSIKRIKLSTKPNSELNQNPSFTNILFKGGTLASYPTEKGSMSLSNPSEPEEYSSETSAGLRTFQENIFISWYASSGEYLFDRTDRDEENEFDPSTATGVFVAIYRDGRGGMTSQVLSF